ncbi:MAG TPA: sialate O-acetylesterase [Puia sp.]|jgi:sialate O-acetylesterase
MMKKILFLFLFAGLGIRGFSMGLQLGSALQNDMVVQQNHPFCVWGRADAGAVVEIRADWMADALTVKTGGDGQFLGIIPVPAVQAGDYKPHRLDVGSGASRISLTNVLIGEVWLCSGQSNMQFSMKEVTDSTREIAAAAYPNFRLLNVDLNFSATPIDSIKGKWMECSPETVRNFSAVGYYFGRELQQTLHVPVGIIFSGIGASAAQAFVPRSVLAADTMLDRVYLEPYLNSPRSKEVINGGFSFEKVTRPFLLYNAMIYALRRFSIRGICWYQGESNRLERDSYTRVTQALIKSWRESFGQGELPFYYVQVAPFFLDKEDPVLADYAFFREAQEKVASVNNTAMVTTVDVGEAKNLHPHNKKPIGVRLAKTALNRIYGLSDIVYRGPHYQHMEIKGKEAVIYFEPGTTAGGLRTDDGSAPLYFTISGEDQVFHPASAVIAGDKIRVWSAAVRKPVAVRYAFTNYPVTHLQNGEGWPVLPFRTDSFPEPEIKTR